MVFFWGMADFPFTRLTVLSKSPRVWTSDEYRPGQPERTFARTTWPGSGNAGAVGWPQALTGRLPHVLKIILGYASVVMLAGIGATLSRGGWLATALSLAVLCGVLLFQRHYRMKARYGGGAGGGGLLAGAEGAAVCRSGPECFHRTHSDDMRFSIWAPAIQMWRTISGGDGPAILTTASRVPAAAGANRARTSRT